MTRAMKLSAFVAMGLVITATTVAAQKAPATTSGGEITISTLGTGAVGSSKFTEYRVVPKGVSIPFMNLHSTSGTLDFNLTGYNVQQKDQRFIGQLKAHGMGLKFNWNQIPHDMGNNAHLIFQETSQGIWNMSASLRQTLQTAVDTKLPTSLRTYDFYSALLAPTFASANLVDNTGIRKTGNVELNLGDKLPFDVTLTYKNEAKEGFRGLGSVNFRERVSPSVEVLNPLNEVTHDIGVRAVKNFARGNVYATFNRNIYDNRADQMQIDFPFQAADAPYTASAGAVPALGGLSRERFVMAPSNEATTSAAGFLLKFKRQTRISASFALQDRTQDAPFYPYTANTALVTPTGAPASSLATLQQRSYGGKVSSTSYNVSFASKPVEGLSLRAQYRVYDVTDKSNKWVATGDVANSNSVWNVVTPSAADPFGHATANVYDTKSSRFSASATYDFHALTLEGQVRNGQLERTSREATKGTENGMGVTALFHASEWLGVRGTYDVGKRTAEGETVYGFQADEAAFTNTRTGVDIELTPANGLDLSVGYFRRNVDYTDRPNRISVSSGVPNVGAVAILNSPSGLLETTYDTYTGEINFAPNARVELGAYYTFEKNANTDQWSSNPAVTLAPNLLNKLNWVATDETNTFGANAVFQLVPDKHTFSINAMRQKVDGFADITANELASFYTPGRVGLVPAGQGGAADIADWDDTELTTVSAQLDCTLTKGWTLSTGYVFEKYDFKDAFNANNKLAPSNLNIFTKPNDGAYDANVVFAKLTFKF